MASFTGSSIKSVYKDILHTSKSNTGIGSSIKQIKAKIYEFNRKSS